MTRTELTFHQRLIAERTCEVDPRYVEAWMRLEYQTLDALSRSEFEREVDEALACIRAAAGPTESEALAASFGL